MSIARMATRLKTHDRTESEAAAIKAEQDRRDTERRRAGALALAEKYGLLPDTAHVTEEAL